jgi:tetraacyldisaccharide 4'-kinase
MTAMRALPQPDVFLLDDGFQHRRVARDFDLVLIDATAPFGFGHVLPRGLLREPVHGLRRADAVIITRFDQATSQELQAIEARARRYVPAGAIYFARHVHAGLRAADGSDVTLTELAQHRFFAFAGIANAQALRRQLENAGRCVGFAAFADHHAYSTQDLAKIRQDSAAAGAALLVTTDKDWVKIRPLPAANEGLSILRLNLRVEFRDGDDDRLLSQILARLEPKQGLRAVSPALSRPG